MPQNTELFAVTSLGMLVGVLGIGLYGTCLLVFVVKNFRRLVDLEISGLKDIALYPRAALMSRPTPARRNVPGESTPPEAANTGIGETGGLESPIEEKPRVEIDVGRVSIIAISILSMVYLVWLHPIWEREIRFHETFLSGLTCTGWFILVCILFRIVIWIEQVVWFLVWIVATAFAVGNIFALLSYVSKRPTQPSGPLS